MTARALLASLALLCGALLSACAPMERITLLPSQDGSPSAVIIKSASGETILDKPYATDTISGGGRVTNTQGEADAVRQKYSSTLSALPQRAAVFMLYFDTATDVLVPESQARLAQIKAELASRPAPEIIVIGHTDTVDTPAYNDALSLKRAETVKRILIDAGIPGESIVAQGRGKRELLVQTKDRVDEPRNRRVEIRVR